MNSPKHNVTDAELAVLKELWALGPSTIRELTDRLYPGGIGRAEAGPEVVWIQNIIQDQEKRRIIVYPIASLLRSSIEK